MIVLERKTLRLKFRKDIMLNVIIKVLVIIVLLEFTILYGAQVYDEYMYWAEFERLYTDIPIEE